MQKIAAPVLVVGSGPAGLVMALILRMNDIDVRIIEKKSTYPIGQRGAGIHPRSLELFHFLGLLPSIEAKALRPPKVRFFAPPPNGDKMVKELDVIPQLQPTQGIPWPNPLLFGQNNLEALLRQSLTEYNCHVELNTELVSFEQHNDHVVAVVTKNEDGEKVTERTKYRWLVGADGAHSVVRKQLGLTFLGETRNGANIILGDIHVKAGVLSKDTWYKWGDFRSTTVGLRPTNEENIYNFWLGGPDVQSRTASLTRNDVLEVFYETTGRHDVEFGELVWIGNYRPNVRMVNKFGEGRVFVAGDAAHVHPPHGGQGMNSSVHDSFNLSWKLALVEKGYSPLSLLDSYSQERIPVIAEMLGIGSGLLDLSLKGEVDKSWKRDGDMNMLGINYRSSSIVLHEGSPKGAVYSSYAPPMCGDLRAGDRAPDASGLVTIDGSRARLFDFFRPTRHTILVFGGNHLSFTKALDVYPQDTLVSIVIVPNGPHPEGVMSLIDQEGHAANGFNVAEGESKVVVVRPDSSVGAILSSVQGLEQYFAGIFI